MWGVALVALVALVAGAVACSSDDGGGDDESGGTTATTVADADPVDYSTRGPYAVGEVDLELDADHQVAVFYPVDRDSVGDDAEAYSYAGDDLFGPEIVSLLPGALGRVSPASTNAIHCLIVTEAVTTSNSSSRTRRISSITSPAGTRTRTTCWPRYV